MSFKRILGALALFAFTTGAMAQAFPNKPIRLVVPFPAGGPLDSMARSLGQAAAPALGQQMVIDNRPGALGTVGSEQVARSPADGYSLLAGFSAGHSLTPAIMNLRFDPMKQLPPLMGVAVSDLVLVTGPQHKGESLQDFVKFAKAKKNITVGAIGTGSTNHLVGELFNRAAGFTGTHVPYQGAAPLALAVMAGEVDLAVLDVGAVRANVESGKMVALAVANSKRSAFLPAVPTTVEAGFGNIAFQNVYGIFLPTGVPTAIREKLYSALAAASQSVLVKEQLTQLGLIAAAMSEGEFEALIIRQRDTLVPLARELKIRLD